MGWPAEFNPIKETEYMMKYNLEDAEKDGVLQFLASTYRAQDNKIVYGTAEKRPSGYRLRADPQVRPRPS